MVVTVNYGRDHLQELFTRDFTIYAGCAKYKDGDDGRFSRLYQGDPCSFPLRGQQLLEKKTFIFPDL